jgi:hypothetical protein
LTTYPIIGSPGVFGDYKCPDGSNYTAFGCDPAFVEPAYNTTLWPASPGNDPYNPEGVRHMELIGAVKDHLFAAFQTNPYTVPEGVNGFPVVFQANDYDLEDNQGSISFHVEVCNPPEELWCYLFDFTTSDYAGIWSLTRGNYQAGFGYTHAVSDYGAIEIPFPTGATQIDRVVDAAGSAQDFAIYVDGSAIQNGNTGGTGVFPYSADLSGGSTIVLTVGGVGSGANRSVIFRGTGTNPFGTSNCT